MIIASLVISIGTALTGFFIKNKAVVFISYGFIIPLALLLPRFFYYFDSKVKKTVNFNWVRKLDFFAFFIVALNAPGSLILHDLNFQYDRFLHFSVGFLSLIIFFFLWLPVTKIKGGCIPKKQFLIFIFFVLFIGLFFWETLQYITDYLFGTKLFFDLGQNISIDSSEDIFFGFLGLVAAVLYLIHNFDKITLPVWK